MHPGYERDTGTTHTVLEPQWPQRSIWQRIKQSRYTRLLMAECLTLLILLAFAVI